MKKIYGYAALFAAMSLASCSSDNEPNVATGEMQKCYIGVNLAVPTQTRASFEVGKDGESDVHSITFVAFDASGNYLSKSLPIKNFQWSDPSNASSVETSSTEKIIELTKRDNQTVGQIMAIVNCPTTLNLEQNLDALRTEVDDYRTTTLDDKEYFVMTNSAYGAGNYATDFTDKVYDTPGEAVNNTVNIYVERVAARVNVSQESSTFKTEYEVKDLTVDGNKTLSVKLTGVQFIYAKDKANLVKDIDGVTDATAFANWKADADFRTHWAAVSEGAKNIELFYKDVEGLSANSTHKFYLNENVDQTYPTYVAVTGQLLLDDKQTEIYQLYNNSAYYTEEGVTNQFLAYLQLDEYKYVQANETETVATSWYDITKDDIEFVASPNGTDYDGYLKIKAKEGYNIVKGTEKLSEGDYTINEKKYRVKVWGGGNTYFYTEIAPADQNGKPGVVRNHVYNLIFDEIGGIGTPLFNPNGELLPKTPDPTDEEGPKWYFNATINILNWTVYTQHIKF